MDQPDTDNSIVLRALSDRVQVRFAGVVVLETTRAIALHEARYPPVLYLPREDARMEFFIRSEKRTHCPRKGGAAYFSLRAGEELAENVVWTYEAPFPAVAPIEGRLAFHAHAVEIDIGPADPPA